MKRIRKMLKENEYKRQHQMHKQQLKLKAVEVSKEYVTN